MIVDELITLLGLKSDPKAKGEAEGFAKNLGKVVTAGLKVVGAITAAAGAVAAFTTVQARNIDTAAKFAEGLGLTYENLQKLEYAVQRVGGSSAALRGDLEKLTKTMASPIPGEYNQTLYMMGISARDASGQLKTADNLLLDIADRLQGMSAQRQQQFADKLGLSQDTLNLIREGRDGINALRDDAVRLGLVLDEASKQKAARFQVSMLNTRSVLDALSKTIAISLMPSMASSLDLFTDWIAANREFIAEGVTQVVEGVAHGFALFGNVLAWVWGLVTQFLGPLDSLVSGLDFVQAIGITVAGVLIVLAAAFVAATWPILAIAAAVIALILVFEDLYAALMGQQSVIGGWANSFAEAFPTISRGIGVIMDLLGALASFAAGALAESFRAGFAIVEAVISGIVGVVENMLMTIEELISGANPFAALADNFKRQAAVIFDTAKQIGSAVGGFFGGMFGSSEMSAPGGFADVPPSVLAPGGNRSVTNNVTNNINGTGNPGAVANEIINRGGLGATLQQSKPGMTGPTVS